MLRHLRIQGFRGFDTLDTDLQSVNVLLGPNSCGKSTVLHAVRLACSALTWTLDQDPEPKMDGDWIVVWWDWPVDKHVAFLPPMQTKDLFLNRGDKPLVITLRFDDTDFIQELRVSLRYGRSDALRLDVRVKSRDTMAFVSGLKPKSRSLSSKLASTLTGKEPTAITIPAFYGVVQDEPYVNDGRLTRQLGAGEQGRIVRNLIGRLSNSKELNDFLFLSVGATITKTTSGQELQLVEALTTIYRDSNGELELSSAGTGLVALAALYSALAWYAPRATKDRPLIFLLDEPEAHLHPKLQGHTGERIAKFVYQFGAQALIATHSVEMINRLGTRPETLLLGIDRNSPLPVVRLTNENEIVERLESFCDLSPFTSLNMLRSRKILFHEGRTDRLILEVCARVRYANDAASLQRFFQWTFVELSSATNAGAKDVLKKALEPLASSTKGEQVVRIVRVLDRDHERKPVLGPEQGDGGIKEFDVVWSGYSIESLFLDPSCLAAWLWYELKDHSRAPQRHELELAVAAGIAVANADEDLIKQASEQIFTRLLRTLPVGQFDSAQKIIQLRRDAEKQVKADPHVYQRSKDRAHCILKHVRSTLPTSLHNKVRREIPDVLKNAPSPSTLVLPALVPMEIEKLLEYMTGS